MFKPERDIIDNRIIKEKNQPIYEEKIVAKTLIPTGIPASERIKGLTMMM